MEPSPVVSVVIPAYNMERYLHECLDSILLQTREDFEIICVDNASTDGTRAILDEYARRDNRLRVLSLSQNRKPGPARNMGLAEAAGKYVYFMDADDILSDANVFADIIALAERESLDQVIFSAENFIDGQMAQDTIKCMNCDYAPPSELCGRVMTGAALAYELLSTRHYSPCLWLRILRTSILREANLTFLADNIHDDSLFVPQSMLASKRACAISRICYQRRIHPSSTMTDPAKAAISYKANLDNLYSWLPYSAAKACDADSAPAISQFSTLFLRCLGNSFYRLDEATAKDAWKELDAAKPAENLLKAFFDIHRKEINQRRQIKKSLHELQQKHHKLLRKLGKMRRQRNARPNSIRACILFVIHRLLARAGLAHGKSQPSTRSGA